MVPRKHAIRSHASVERRCKELNASKRLLNYIASIHDGAAGFLGMLKDSGLPMVQIIEAVRESDASA